MATEAMFGHEPGLGKDGHLVEARLEAKALVFVLKIEHTAAL